MDNNESDLGLGISSVSPGPVDAIQSPKDIGELSLVAPGNYRVVRRNGSIASFDIDKISVAMTKAFLAVEGNQAAASSRILRAKGSLAAQFSPLFSLPSSWIGMSLKSLMTLILDPFA